MNYNKVLLAGRLCRDVEIRHTPTGTAVADLGLAVNESYKNKAGEMVEQTVFVDITCWERQAEAAAEFLSKGSPIFVEGKLQLDMWTTDGGEKRTKLRVRADRIQFLGGKPSGKGNGQDRANAGDPDGNKAREQEDDTDIPF